MPVTELIVDVLVARWAQKLGQGNRWWFPARLDPPPDEFYIMMSGSQTGPFLMISEGIGEAKYLPEQDLFVYEPLDATKQALIREDNFFAKHGLTYVGFNAYFLEREMYYESWEQLPGQKPGEPVRWGLVPQKRGHWHENKPPSYFWRYSIGVLIDDAETATGDVAVDMIVKLTVEIESPRRAFFHEGGWIAAVNTMVKSLGRHHAKPKTFEELAQEKDQENSAFAALIKGLNGDSREDEGSLRELVGVKIKAANLVLIAYSGSEEIRAATELVRIAELKKKARELEGEGEELFLKAKARGEREHVAAYSEHEVGAAVALRDAIAEAKPGTVVLGQGITPSVDVTKAPRKSLEKAKPDENQENKKE